MIAEVSGLYRINVAVISQQTQQTGKEGIICIVCRCTFINGAITKPIY